MRGLEGDLGGPIETSERTEAMCNGRAACFEDDLTRFKRQLLADVAAGNQRLLNENIHASRTEMVAVRAQLGEYNENFQRNQQRINNLEERITQLEVKFEEMYQYQRQDNEEIINLRGALRADHNNIDEIDRRFQELSVKLQEVNRSRSATSGPFNNTVTAKPKVKFRFLVYKGDPKERPVQFVRDFIKYIEINELDVYEAMVVISQCLQGNALKWWNLTENSLNNFKEFAVAFKGRFWNLPIQKY